MLRRMCDRLLSPSHIFCDQCQQILHLKGLGEKMIRTCIPGHALHLFMSGEEDDWNVLCSFLVFELPTNLLSIGSREPDI